MDARDIILNIERLGISRAQLSRDTGISEALLSMIINGKTSGKSKIPTLQTYLYGQSEPPSTPTLPSPSARVVESTPTPQVQRGMAQYQQAQAPVSMQRAPTQSPAYARQVQVIISSQQKQIAALQSRVVALEQRNTALLPSPKRYASHDAAQAMADNLVTILRSPSQSRIPAQPARTHPQQPAIAAPRPGSMMAMAGRGPVTQPAPQEKRPSFWQRLLAPW